MLRLSKLTDYGTMVMTYLSREPARVHNAAEISGAVGLTLPTVSKLLKMLAKGDLLVSHRGTKGGYTLSRGSDEISVAEIIDALEGPIAMTECSSAPGLCEQETDCSVRANWMKINNAVRSALESVTLADMSEPPAVQRVDVSRLRRTARATLG